MQSQTSFPGHQRLALHICPPPYLLLEQYQETVKINSKHGDAYNNLANLYYMDEKYQQALDYLNLAEKYGAKIHPEFKKAILKAIKKNPY